MSKPTDYTDEPPSLSYPTPSNGVDHQDQGAVTTPDSNEISEKEVANKKAEGDYANLHQKSKKEIWKFRGRLLGALLIPTFLETLDYTVVATAQPHIASQFGRLDLQSWIGTAYLLTSTVFLPLYGSLADVFGRHWALQTSLVWFIIGSALSTGAQNMPMMLAGRGIAGVGAAGFLTVTRVILADSRSLNENTVQTSMMIVLYSLGYSLGPVIGGYLTSVTFRWVFAINLPCSVLGMILVFLLLRGHVKGPQPSSRQRARQRAREHNPVFARTANPQKHTWLNKLLSIDFVGGFLFIVAGILVLLGLTWGSTAAWNSARVIVTLTVGGLLFVATLAWELLIERYDDPDRAKAPPRILEAEAMLPIPIFKNWDTVICQYVALTSGMVMLVMFYFVAIFFTIVQGQDPSQAGIQLIYFAPGVGAGVIASTQIIRWTRQPKWPIIGGTVLVPISLGLISRAINVSQEGQVNGFMAMAGVSIGLTFGPIGIHARFSQPANRVAVVEALQLFFRTLGGTIGLAQCATVMNSRVKSTITALIASGAFNPSDIPGGTSGDSAASIASISVLQNLPSDVQNAIKDAYRNGTRWAFISLIPWTALACFFVIFLSDIQDTDAMRAEKAAREKETLEEKEKHQQEIREHPNYAALGPKPSSKGIYGPVTYIIYLVKKSKWERKKRQLDRQAVNV